MALKRTSSFTCVLPALHRIIYRTLPPGFRLTTAHTTGTSLPHICIISQYRSS